VCAACIFIGVLKSTIAASRLSVSSLLCQHFLPLVKYCALVDQASENRDPAGTSNSVGSCVKIKYTLATNDQIAMP